MGKRSRKRKDDEEGPTERPPAVEALLGAGPAPETASAEAEAESNGAGASPAPTNGLTGKGADRQGPPARHPAPDGRLREVAFLVEEADHLLHLYRWILLTAEVPKAQDWLKREDWPHPDHVIEVFGNWQKFLTHAGVADSPLLARLREAKSAEKDLAAREKAMDKESARAEELHRQLEKAKQRREEADARRAEEGGRADRAERALASAELRAATGEERIKNLRKQQADDAAVADAPDEQVSSLQGELEAISAHRDELLTRLDELQEARRVDERTIARLSALLAEAGSSEQTGSVDAVTEPPASVAEAVARAAASAEHLIFTEAATASAADSPYRRPAEILEALEKLDGLAGRYAQGEMGASLTQAATDAGLTYKGNVSEIARSRNPHDYTVTHDGERLDLGPHVALGSGSGAGFIARIYLHVADGSGPVARGLYVGHVGRHLPDTTT
ncbi:MAG: hypothetical protein H0V81_11320 [Solirubrobacterales bacterium]|nr:hypothetical protein [Solirubrobacterales bacterium]